MASILKADPAGWALRLIHTKWAEWAKPSSWCTSAAPSEHCYSSALPSTHPPHTYPFHVVWQMHTLGQGAAFAHLVQGHCSKISFILTGWRLQSSIKDTANFRDKREHTGITAWSQQSLQHLTQPFLTILSNSLLMLWITSNSLWWNSYLLKTKNRWLPCFVDPYSDVSVSFPFHSIITFHFK